MQHHARKSAGSADHDHSEDFPVHCGAGREALHRTHAVRQEKRHGELYSFVWRGVVGVILLLELLASISDWILTRSEALFGWAGEFLWGQVLNFACLLKYKKHYHNKVVFYCLMMTSTELYVFSISLAGNWHQGISSSCSTPPVSGDKHCRVSDGNVEESESSRALLSEMCWMSLHLWPCHAQITAFYSLSYVTLAYL